MKILVLSTFILAASLLYSILSPPILTSIKILFVHLSFRIHSTLGQSKLDRSWPDALLLMAGCLKAGGTVGESLELLLAGSPEPLRSHLKKKGGDGFFCLPVPDQIARLFEGPSLSLVRGVLQLSHETGGRTAPLLETAADLFRKKLEMKEKVKMLTAQGRMSAWVVGLSPLGMLVLFHLLVPEFIEPLFKTQAGHLLLVLVFFLVVTGLITVHRVVRIQP